MSNKSWKTYTKSRRTYTKSRKTYTKSRNKNLDQETLDGLLNWIPPQSVQQSHALKKTVSISPSTPQFGDDLLVEKKQSNKIKYEKDSIGGGVDDTTELTKLSDITKVTGTLTEITDGSDTTKVPSVIRSTEKCRNRSRHSQMKSVLDTIDENEINRAKFSPYSPSTSHCVAKRSTGSQCRLVIEKISIEEWLYSYCRDMFRIFLKAFVITALISFVILILELLVYHFLLRP